MRKITSSLIMLLGLCSFGSYGQLIEMKTQRLTPLDVSTIKIVYSAPVTNASVADLMKALDGITMNYPNTKQVSLYINSPGGDMDAGYAGYAAIKNFSLPIETVNLSQVASAATLMYCAAQNRRSMPDAIFLLHPAALPMHNVSGELKPNDIKTLSQSLSIGNNLFASIYKVCTRYDAAALDTILSSEANRKLLYYSEAQTQGLITQAATEMKPVDVAYYIN